MYLALKNGVGEETTKERRFFQYYTKESALKLINSDSRVNDTKITMWITPATLPASDCAHNEILNILLWRKGTAG